MKTSPRGVSKRKGNRSRLLTRNRSKVEKLRESLDYLKLEEKQIEPTKDKVSADGATLRVLLHDLSAPDGARGVKVPIQTSSRLPLGGTIIKKHTWQKGLKQIPSEELTRNRFESCPDFSFSRSDEENDALSKKSKLVDGKNDECQTHESYTSVSKTASMTENSPKRKCDSDVQETKLKNLKGSSSRFEWEKLGQFSAISSEESPSPTSQETHIAIDNDQHSPSPPNSLLYDMPPPSTPAQKQARRAKRRLQVERWKKYEVSKSRQERYQRRTQGAAETTLSLDSRHVQWSHDLVQTVYFDDEFE